MSKKDKQRAAASKKSRSAAAAAAFRYLAAAVYAFSVFFWGSVTMLAIFRDYYADYPPPAWVSICMGAGWLVLTASAVISLFKKDIIAFLLSIAGTALFLTAASWFVKAVRHQIETKSVTNDFLDLDREYIFRYFPSAAIPVLLAVPVTMKIAGYIRKKRQQKLEKQSEPVKSIVD